MPIQDPIERKEYQARWYREHREEIKIKRQLRAGSRQISENALRREKRRALENATKRPQGESYTERLFIPPTRGWDVFEGRLYFSSALGYTIEDVEAILHAVHKGQNRPYIPRATAADTTTAPVKTKTKPATQDKTPGKPTSKKQARPQAQAKPKTKPNPKAKRKP